MSGSGRHTKQIEMILVGNTAPLGVSCVKEEFCKEFYNFAVFVPGASECELKIYDLDKGEAVASLSLPRLVKQPGMFAGAVSKDEMPGRWGYRYAAGGREFVDPYAKYTAGREQFGVPGELFGMAEESEDGKPFSWKADVGPRLAYEDMILYKLNVRGFTMTAPGVRHKGTYLGLLEKKKYLLELGINAVLLLPCVEFNEIIHRDNSYKSLPYSAKIMMPKSDKTEEGIKKAYHTNLWGFGAESLYFAPKASYAADPSHAGREFKQMVKGLHESGIEVLLEMDFKQADSPSFILDCLSWWVKEYHIDGFRIGAGLIPARFLTENPEFAGVKFISQGFEHTPVFRTDTHPSYSGKMHIQTVLAEYNDGFLSEVRRFVKGDEEMVGSVAARLERQSGSIGIINYIADNNGFTLYDLYSYDVKHNEGNGEDNRDGSDYNFSWNCGIEGSTKKKKILKLRDQMRRNALTFLFFAQGTPMILAGDEFGNSQGGNNNAYCQDNEVGWVSWSGFRKEQELFRFVKTLIALRKIHPVLHNKIPLRGMDYISCGCPDVSRHGTKAWYPDYSNYSRTLAVLLCGSYAKTKVFESDCSFYLAANMHWEPHDFALPAINNGETLVFLLSTADCTEKEELKEDNNGARTFTVPPRSIALFCGKREEEKPRAHRKRGAKAAGNLKNKNQDKTDEKNSQITEQKEISADKESSQITEQKEISDDKEVFDLDKYVDDREQDYGGGL